MATVKARGFFTATDLGKDDNTAISKSGGRVDILNRINEIDVQLSLTDSSVRDYDSAPWIRDLLLTAHKKVNDNLTVGVGYDLGAKNAVVSVQSDTVVADRDVTAKATWFQNGNHVRTEATARLDSRQTLWGAYTFNDDSNTANPTFINLKEREGFIIAPFTLPVATQAAKYTFEKDDYVIEPAYDFNKKSAYLSVSKRQDNSIVKASYAFKEETALVEISHRPAREEIPVVRFYAKGPLGAGGVGPLSLGFILDKEFEL